MTSTVTLLSFNEIRFHFTRAAVGVGAPFGIGEDFAAMSIWLARLGADPAELAALALDGIASGTSSTRMFTDKQDGKISFRGIDRPALAAIYCGPAAADRLAVEAGKSASSRIVLENVDQPALVAAAIALEAIDGALVCWSEAASDRGVMFQGGSIGLLSGDELNGVTSPVDVEISLISGTGAPRQVSRISAHQLADRTRQVVEAGVTVSRTPWATVYRHFNRCLVPSTDESRLEGAGAGLTDND